MEWASKAGWGRVSGAQTSMPIVVSYFTDAFYQREAFELTRTCQAFALDYMVERIEDAGSWIGNTNQKPFFLRRMHAQLMDRALLWLDADARIRRFPKLLMSLNVPIAYHTWVDGHFPASGTVYLQAGPQRGLLLDEWCRQVEQGPTLTDQICMGRAVDNLSMSHGELPQDYCWIFDHGEDGRSVRTLDPRTYPVIEHMQASRYAKDLDQSKKSKVCK